MRACNTMNLTMRYIDAASNPSNSQCYKFIEDLVYQLMACRTRCGGSLPNVFVDHVCLEP